ncbi:MAG: hypothetical protein NWE95_07785 [Candidatus Bathyarchaeota archaeon]|nr:hypothetical protein [Candidatus Bathyarchaeota archaeon]
MAREDLLNRLGEVAKERGSSLYELVNETFELVITSQNLGLNLKKIVDSRKRLEDARALGFILGLESLWYEMADLAYEKGKRQALKSWFDAGVWFATRYVTGNGDSPLLAFKNDLAGLTWNVPEFVLEDNYDRVSVRVTSPRFTESYTILFSAFLEGAMKAFGYKIDSRDVSRGVIRLEALKEEVHGST